MKTITKISMIVLISLFCLQSNAQTIAVKAGLNLSNVLDEDDDGVYSTDYTSNTGFHVGATVAVPLSDILSFESGLLLTTKGFRLEQTDAGVALSADVNLIYVDIPLTLTASHDIGSDISIFWALGPYVGLGVAGKVKSSVSFFGITESEEEAIDWGSDDEKHDLKRLDMGLTFGAGVEF
jgi:hypothetical protein